MLSNGHQMTKNAIKIIQSLQKYLYYFTFYTFIVLMKRQFSSLPSTSEFQTLEVLVLAYNLAKL